MRSLPSNVPRCRAVAHDDALDLDGAAEASLDALRVLVQEAQNALPDHAATDHSDTNLAHAILRTRASLAQNPRSARFVDRPRSERATGSRGD